MASRNSHNYDTQRSFTTNASSNNFLYLILSNIHQHKHLELWQCRICLFKDTVSAGFTIFCLSVRFTRPTRVSVNRRKKLWRFPNDPGIHEINHRFVSQLYTMNRHCIQSQHEGLLDYLPEGVVCALGWKANRTKKLGHISSKLCIV